MSTAPVAFQLQIVDEDLFGIEADLGFQFGHSEIAKLQRVSLEGSLGHGRPFCIGRVNRRVEPTCQASKFAGRGNGPLKRRRR